MSDVEKSPEEDEGSAARSPASSDDDMARPHVYATVTGHPPAPPLPARTRGSIGGSEGRQRKTRARSPVNEDTRRTSEDVQTSDAAPAVPPRVPLYLCPSTGSVLRVSTRPVLYPRPPVEVPSVPSVPCALNPQLSASDILRSRPPPPARDAIPSISFSPTEKPTENPFMSSDFVDRISLTSLNASRDSDLVWWPSEEQRSQLSNQVLQLTHWPIPSLPPSTTDAADASTSRPPRRMNDYVDGPVTSLQSNARSTTLDGLQRTHVQHDSQTTVQPASSLSRHPQNPEISVSLAKAKTSESDSTLCRQSILCSRCGKCRCKQCTESRPLPRVWLGERECSAQAAVDCTTCMCVARALFYHCRSAEESDYSDDPCACTEQRDCCKRWTALSLLSLCLPCLCLYWPLEGAVRLCTACYNRRHGRGCRCPSEMQTSASKGLLLDSESSSSS